MDAFHEYVHRRVEARPATSVTGCVDEFQWRSQCDAAATTAAATRRTQGTTVAAVVPPAAVIAGSAAAAGAPPEPRRRRPAPKGSSDNEGLSPRRSPASPVGSRFWHQWRRCTSVKTFTDQVAQSQGLGLSAPNGGLRARRRHLSTSIQMTYESKQ